MSTMTKAEVLVERPLALSLVMPKPIEIDSQNQSTEAHPLIVVFIAAFIAFNLSAGMIGSVLIWLSLRHSGVMAP